jgi:N-acetylglutamate synthase-like GNAT family acetyltransferase
VGVSESENRNYFRHADSRFQRSIVQSGNGAEVEFMSATGNAMKTSFHIRPATPQDVPILRELIDASVRRLQAQDYSPAQIEAALKSVVGVDSQLIADGTYLVAEANVWVEKSSSLGNEVPARDASGPVIVGCGGWSKRNTLFGGDQWAARKDSLLDPRSDAAKIRAFFVHPNWARQGVGTRILQACEDAAKAAGFTRLEMGATLTGVKLFQARGYVALESLEVPTKEGVSLPIMRMEKRI